MIQVSAVERSTMSTGWKTALLTLSVLTVALIALPLVQMEFLARMPGNLGDARLNNYFLENVYQFAVGQRPSLWTLPFFSPYPFTGGFSENLVGSSPIYIISRALGIKPDTSFQFWFLCGYVANFYAAYYALRRLDLDVCASSFGALIFAFALPTTGHSGHAQLHYRFGIPLSLTYMLLFLRGGSIKDAFFVMFWLVFQFFVSIYMGFFNLLFLFFLSFSWFGLGTIGLIQRPFSFFYDLKADWNRKTLFSKIVIIIIPSLFVGIMGILFYPYIRVSQLYGAKRVWADIVPMLPRPQSYFLSDSSLILNGGIFDVFKTLPERHEHQMWLGFVPLFFATIGVIFAVAKRQWIVLSFAITAAIAITTTLYIQGWSIWYVFHLLPLASAIRAVTRLDQALLFPVAVISAYGFQAMAAHFIVFSNQATRVGLFIIAIAECSLVVMETLPKSMWRERIEAISARIPSDDQQKPVLFFSQLTSLTYADELDAMWLSFLKQKETLNGYSGVLPAGFRYQYFQDCSEVPKRVIAYLNFINASDNANYVRAIERVQPIGFIGCDPKWWRERPLISTSQRDYTADEIRRLQLQPSVTRLGPNLYELQIRIRNDSATLFSALSGTGHPLRLSWRFMDGGRQAITDFTPRHDLPFDILPNETSQFTIPIKGPFPAAAGAIEVSLVQEGVFWGHQMGMKLGIAPLPLP